ncbi:MAG TPA: hypothetical protein VIJ72_03955 [Rhizomicrobium sp.]
MRARSLFPFCLLLLLCACGRDQRTDLQKLSDFHKQLVAIDHRVTAASNAYTSASTAALNSSNRGTLYQDAATLRLSMVDLLPQVQAITVPDFKNKDAASDAGQALAALTAEISALQDTGDALQAMSDPHNPALGQIAAAAQAQDQANSAAVEESSEIVQAYEDLGIAPDAVDLANGGLKTK